VDEASTRLNSRTRSYLTTFPEPTSLKTQTCKDIKLNKLTLNRQTPNKRNIKRIRNIEIKVGVGEEVMNHQCRKKKW